MSEPLTGLELRSTITSAGELLLELVEVAVDEPGPDEVVVRVEATPINPSDLGLLLGPADISTITAAGTAERPTIRATIPQSAMAGVQARLDQSMPVGNEGAGTVVKAGPSAAALLGKRVGMFGGGMYTQYRKLSVRECAVLPGNATAAEGAAMFVNPLTALAFVETMRLEGHGALVHTAAASNLGQMLNRICLADGIPLVNIVRSQEQARILQDIGARYIIDSSLPDFKAQLVDALAETRATIAFDAIGGGAMVSDILRAMEAAANREATVYHRYGSTTFKQVYIYGTLDTGPTILKRAFGWSWSVSGWLLTPFLQKADAETMERMRQRISDELTTTFASHYTATISLADVLRPDVLAACNRRRTGEKYLIDPSRPLKA